MSQNGNASFLSPIAGEFSDVLSDEARSAIIESLWSVVSDNDHVLRKLQFYFGYYADQTTLPVIRKTARYGRGAGEQPILSSVKTHKDLMHYVNFMKCHPTTARKDLKLLQLAECDQIQETPIDQDMAFDLAARVMLMVGCRSAANTITTGQVFMPSWKDTESLVDFVERVLPRQEIEHGNIVETVRAQKLKATYLKDYANFKIEWTDNLPDHLHLHITEHSKSLRIFRHAGFLEVSLQILECHGEKLSTAESLKLYVSL